MYGSIQVEEPQEVSSAFSLQARLRDALLQPGDLNIHILGTGRIHTAVLQVLIAAQRSCNTAERSLTISGIVPDMVTLLQMAGLNISDHVQNEALNKLP